MVENSEETVVGLRAGFGEEVANLVAVLADDESIADWSARKQEHRVRVAAAGRRRPGDLRPDKLTN